MQEQDDGSKIGKKGSSQFSETEGHTHAQIHESNIGLRESVQLSAVNPHKHEQVFTSKNGSDS
jgi:hypothetical protein